MSKDIQDELGKLLWCDLLVLNFPIFWYSTPAILKGWIDRVFVSGVTYGGKRLYDRGGLVGKRVLVSVTLGGQKHMFGEQGIHGPLEDMLKPLLQGTLGYTGFSVHHPFVGWHIPYLSDAGRVSVMRAWRDRLAGLHDERDWWPQPTLKDFDERLRRLGPSDAGA